MSDSTAASATSHPAGLPLTQAFRSQMPVTGRWAYLDHAAVGPLTQAAGEAITQYLQQCTQSGDVHWPQWAAQVEETRQAAAQLIGADPPEIALVHSTTEGITLVAEGMDWAPGDNVVLPAGEFPSNVYPWLNLRDRGVEVRQVEMPSPALDLPRLAQACDRRTRILSCSWVGFASGYRCEPRELAQIAHDCGAYFFLDAIQGLGVFPLDVRACGVDFMAADGHKWMLGPEGAGIAYIRHELLDRLRPNIVGWNSVIERFNYQKIELKLRPEAARYEAGTQNMVGQLGLGGSLRTFLQMGLSPTSNCLAEPVLEQAAWLRQQLDGLGAQVSDLPAAHQSGIVLFRLPEHDPMTVRQRLLERQVVCSCRGGGIRVAIHAYNDRQDLERLLDVVEGMR